MRHALLATLILAVSACQGPKGADGPVGPPGPKGDPGPGGGMPSVSSVIPSRLANTLSADVAVSGFGTHWTSTSQVSFGAGVKVNKVSVGSETGLVASITVDENAAAGTRDVTVTAGTEVSTFKGVFTVVPLFDAKPIGTASRGGYWYYDVHANDPDFTFSGIVDVSVGPQPTDGGTLTADVTTQKPREVVVQLHADFLAPLTKYHATLSWDNGGSLQLPEFELGDKSELSLGDGAPLNGVLMMPFESKLVKYTPGSTPAEVVLHVSAGLASQPQLVLLDDTGSAMSTSGSMGAPGPGNDLVITPTMAGQYLVLSETSGAMNAMFTVTAVPGVMAVPEATGNLTQDMAMPLTLASLASDMGVRVAGTSTAFTEAWYKVTAAAGDVGKRLHIRSYNKAYIYFTYTVLKPDGSQLAQQHKSSITNDLYTPPLPAEGDYLISLEGDEDGAYDLIISLQ